MCGQTADPSTALRFGRDDTFLESVKVEDRLASCKTHLSRFAAKMGHPCCVVRAWVVRLPIPAGIDWER
jgi:hypothetical protein